MKLEKLVKEIMKYNPRSPYFKTRINRKPDMIILHTTRDSFEGYCSTTIEDDIDTYVNEKNPLAHLELSPHYLVLDDWMFVDGEVYSTIINMVNPNNVAHHAGESVWEGKKKLNENSLGIEVRGYTNKVLTRAQYNSLYALVQFLMEKYDIPLNRVLGHYQVAPERKIDPGETIMKNVWDELTNKLHKDSLIIDAHQDTILNVLDKGEDLSVESDFYEVDIPRMRKGGLNIAFFALFTGKRHRHKGKRLRQLLECFQETMKNNSKDLKQIMNLEDIDNLGDKIGIVLSVEGAAGVGDYVPLEELYEAGVRCLSLTHNPQNRYATGIHGKPNRGVTKEGKELIKKLDDLGVIVDVSHLNEKSFWDVVEYSQKPIIASHSNCFNMHPHMRNLKDDQIKAIAEKDGVIGINSWRDVVGYQKRVVNLVYHVDYIVKLVGIDHVGLGTDFGVLQGYVTKDLEDVSKLKNLTKELVKNGYTNKGIRKIFGENYLRVFKKVWKK